MPALALDLGGSHLGCAVVDRGQVLAGSTIKTNARSLKAVLPAVKDMLQQHCGTLGIVPGDCRGLGIGFPGIIDSLRGEILATLGKFEDMSGEELLTWSERELGVAARLENDARLALLGEHSAGAAQGYEDVVMVTLGTGIGGAAMLQGRLLHSRMGQAGCLGGHLAVAWQGLPCVCGGVGCAEAQASTAALPAICRAWTGYRESRLAQEPVLDFAALFRCKDEGDHVAREVVEQCIAIWASLAVSLTHAYGPELMLFGGAVMARAEEILPAIRSFVEKHAWKTSRGTMKIERAALHESAALIGAEALFAEERR